MTEWIPWGDAPKNKPILAWLGEPYDCADVIEWCDDLGCWPFLSLSLAEARGLSEKS